MNGLDSNNKILESIKYIDESCNEYWIAKELQKTLYYKEWRKYIGVINKAIKLYKNNNYKYNTSRIIKNAKWKESNYSLLSNNSLILFFALFNES